MTELKGINPSQLIKPRLRKTLNQNSVLIETWNIEKKVKKALKAGKTEENNDYIRTNINTD